jgi:putative DNA primase/helicase
MTETVDQDSDERTLNSTEAIKAKVEDRVLSELKAYPESHEEDESGISSRFVRQCINANELGDGLLFNALNQGKFVYKASSSEWLHWTGHYWSSDTLEKVLAAVETVVDRLIQETEAIAGEIGTALKAGEKERVSDLEQLRKGIIRRIDKLRTDRGRNMCVKFSRTCSRDPLAIKGEEMNRDPWLLACQNGVLNLASGKFRDGRPGDLISMPCSVEWRGMDEPAPIFERSLKEIFEGDDELIQFLQRLLGYSITGLSHEHIFVVFFGSGRNGKSTLVEILNYILGSLAGSIPSEMLLSSKYVRSSSGPTPDIMSLKGLRIAFASETDDNQKFSTSKVKWLSGGDTLVARSPHDKYPVRFLPTHKLFLISNFKPQAPGDDFAFWERLLLIPFRLSFVARDPVTETERRARKGVVDELKAEASGILAWMVRGCLEYQKQGLNPSEVVRAATAEYKRDEDLLGQWITDCCRVGEGLEQKSSELYASFEKWFEKNISGNVPKTVRFSKMMLRRFDRKNFRGCRYYTGVELIN